MSRKFASTSLAASCAALLLAACGGGGSTGRTGDQDGPPPPAPLTMEQRAATQRTDITTAEDKLRTALTALSATNPTAQQVQDVEQAVTELNTALTNAADVPNDDASRTMAQDPIDTARNRVDPAKQYLRSAGIVSRADSLIASSLSEQRGSAAVTDYKPSCTGTTCTFTSPTETLKPSERLGENFVINLANPTTRSTSLGTQHDITLIQSTWSSANLGNPVPDEDLNYTVFGAWMEHSVFFTAVIQGQWDGKDYNSNRSMAAGQLSNSRPSGNATWQGRMVGSLLTGTNRGDKLQGDATLTYSLTTRMLDAAFTDIRNMDTQEAHSVPSVGFTGVPVDEQGRFEDGITGGSDNEPWIQGNFYGPEHDETAGVFRKSHIVGAFGAKQQ